MFLGDSRSGRSRYLRVPLGIVIVHRRSEYRMIRRSESEGLSPVNERGSSRRLTLDGNPTPAAATTPPNRFPVCLIQSAPEVTAAWMLEVSVTSVCTNFALSAPNRLTTSSSRPGCKSSSSTLAPARWSSRAVSSPSPEHPPDMMKVASAGFMVGVQSTGRCKEEVGK